MKSFVNSVGLLYTIIMLSCNQSISQTKGQQLNRFLYLTELDTVKGNYGVHIEVRQVLPVTSELIPMSIDDRDIIARSKYGKEDQIILLGEYLTFRGDTSTSNKRFRFKAASHMVSPEGVEGFTVEIEALYSFTRMFTQGLPPIKPALINRVTGKQLNTNPKVVSEVYDIYTEWYKENIKTGFKNIFLPLTGSPYCWLGETNDMGPFLKKYL